MLRASASRSVITPTRSRLGARQFLQAATAGLISFAWAQTACAQSDSNPTSSATRTQVTFADLGSPALELRGTQPSGTINLGVRGDEVVLAAKLRLRLTYSPARLPQLSHIRVSLNDQVLATLPLPVEGC